MTANTRSSLDRVNGLRTLELGSALYWLKEQLARRLGRGPRTISTVGRRTKEEQEIAGMSQILFMMYPLAIELALKSLKGHLHVKGQYDHRHELDELFTSLPVDAKDANEAKRAQDEASASWKKFQDDGLVGFAGTLKQFLNEHSRDFIRIRYYDWTNLKDSPLKDLEACYFSILQPLIVRDHETQINFLDQLSP
ncbi:MAG: hypothetical protein OXI46_06330 [Gemmatimonadota bacterium]|nr:hypothetical protein [Gemmatimonadota bacterium]